MTYSWPGGGRQYTQLTSPPRSRNSHAAAFFRSARSPAEPISDAPERSADSEGEAELPVTDGPGERHGAEARSQEDRDAQQHADAADGRRPRVDGRVARIAGTEARRRALLPDDGA